MFPLQDILPRRRSPFVTWTIIAINVFFFFIEISLPQEALRAIIFKYGVVPARYTDPHWPEHAISYWPFITNMFLHGGWMHLIGNMWTLWIFGDNVEDTLGHFRYLIFYFLCGITASITHVIFSHSTTVPAIGASGAIAGVMGAYFLLFPHSRIIAFIPIFFFPWFIEVPAVFYFGFWFLSQLLSGTITNIVAPRMGGGIAWWAHIGGFIAGMILVPILKGRRRRRRNYFADEMVPIRYLTRL